MGQSERIGLFGIAVVLVAGVALAPPASGRSRREEAEQRYEEDRDRDEAPQAQPSELEEAVLRGMNAARRKHGRAPLAADNVLTRAARDYSRLMGREHFFSHTSPSGKTLETRLRAARVDYQSACENLFMCENFPRPADETVNGWMESPGHRKNMLNPEFTRVGIGVYREGRAYYVTAEFLRPARERQSLRAGD